MARKIRSEMGIREPIRAGQRHPYAFAKCAYRIFWEFSECEYPENLKNCQDQK